METVSGTVTAVRKDKKGFQVDDGEWFSSWDPVSVNRGDSVVFNYKTKGSFKNVAGKIRIDTSAAPAPKSGGRKDYNLGVELGHAANLAQRVMEVMYCEDQMDASEVEVGSAKYWATFSEQTLRAYKVMRALRSKVEGGDDTPDESPVESKPAEVRIEVANPTPDESFEDLF